MDNNFSNVEEYIYALVSTIWITNMTAPTPMPGDLIGYWVEEIEKRCNERYESYVKGDIDDFRLGEEEIMEELLGYAKDKLIAEALSNLVDRELMSMSVGEDGEILYKATDKGKEYIEQHKDLL
jgi:hypothetical protein